MAKEPLFPHVPEKREPLYPHRPRGQAMPQTYSEEYCGFEDIKDPQVITKIRELLKTGIYSEDYFGVRDRCYTQKELMDLADKFIEVEKAVSAGLPNEMYDMLIHLTNADVGCAACKIASIWLAHEGKDYAKKHIQEWTDDIKEKIDRLTKEDLEKLENKMFLRGES